MDCRYCGNKACIRYGTYNGQQRWLCPVCRRKFSDYEKPFGMRHTIEDIAITLSNFYISEHAKSDLPAVSDITQYNWLKKYIPVLQSKLADYQYKPKLGSVWMVVEVYRFKGNDRVCIVNLIDLKTRFLLGGLNVQESTRRKNFDLRNVVAFLHNKFEQYQQQPDTILFFQYNVYFDRKNMDYFKNALNKNPFRLKVIQATNNEMLGYYANILQSKLRPSFYYGLGFSYIRDTWDDYYNYLWPQRRLGERTPAELSGISFPYHSWDDLIKVY